VRKVPCPRCHQVCGWCSDYRHMHGLLRLPGSKRRCGVPGFEPEGRDCPVCGGDMEVLQDVRYRRLPADGPKGQGKDGDAVPGAEGDRRDTP